MLFCNTFNGVSFAVIQFGYELTAIPVTEDSGTTQVVFGKLGSVTTEVVLTVMVDFASISVGTEEGCFLPSL